MQLPYSVRWLFCGWGRTSGVCALSRETMGEVWPVLSSLLPLGVLASASPKCSMALVCCCCASSASCPAMAYMELVASGYFFLREKKKGKGKPFSCMDCHETEYLCCPRQLQRLPANKASGRVSKKVASLCSGKCYIWDLSVPTSFFC